MGAEQPPSSALSMVVDPQAILAKMLQLEDAPLLQLIGSVLAKNPHLTPGIMSVSCPDFTYAPSKALTDRRSSGTISKASRKEGGSISCTELEAVFGCEVFIHKNQLGAFVEGQQVSFAVFLTEDNKPRAFDLLRVDASGDGGGGAAGLVNMASSLGGFGTIGMGGVGLVGAGMASGSSATLGSMGSGGTNPMGNDQLLGEFLGIVRSVNEDGGFGFIASDMLKAVGVSEDAYVHKHYLEGFTVGSEVSFVAFLDGRNGRPRAKDLRGATGKVGLQAAVGSASRGDQVVLGQYVGIVKSYNAAKGFGFLSCPDLNSEGHSGDVYLHQKHAQSRSFQVGDHVSFTAYLHAGRLQGRDLQEPGPAAKRLRADTGSMAATASLPGAAPVTAAMGTSVGGV